VDRIARRAGNGSEQVHGRWPGRRGMGCRHARGQDRPNVLRDMCRVLIRPGCGTGRAERQAERFHPVVVSVCDGGPAKRSEHGGIPRGVYCCSG
jgi:hypothetical protein